MKNKSIPANPMEIAKIRMLLKAPTSINKMINSGSVESFCYWLPDEGYFEVKKIANTGDFNKDYKITKRLLDDKNPKAGRFLILDEIDKYPEKFLGTVINGDKRSFCYSTELRQDIQKQISNIIKERKND